ncbi:MAG: hydrogenase expression/formation protein HypE [Desulfovibrionaceae bacterium]|nr:hydrogenase expression/formation protein HypE [Desulfovibrionaceae bacterium]
MSDILLLDHGSGGRASQRLINEVFVSRFSNPMLDSLNDAARLEISGPLSMSTDSYTVDPIFFPGGDIGSLAVHGTVNDVAMLGAEPLFISCAFIIEEGFSLNELTRIADSMAHAARSAGVSIVTGDTKVVPRGAADKLFINTTGIGRIVADPMPGGNRAQPGDAVLVSGPVGDHGLAVMSSRAGLSLASEVKSDSAAVHEMILNLIKAGIKLHALRDPTRGGLATTLNEIAAQSQLVLELEQTAIPVRKGVSQAASILGLDPLYLACEGRVIVIVPAEEAEAALKIMRGSPHGEQTCCIGRALQPGPDTGRVGQVLLKTPIGGKRLLSMLEGEQLPRIC